MAHQHLSLHEIRALDCPAISDTFSDDEIIEGVRTMLRNRTKAVDSAPVSTVFVFAYSHYNDAPVPSPSAFERGDRDYKHWVRTRTLPDYMGSFFKKYLEERAAAAA